MSHSKFSDHFPAPERLTVNRAALSIRERLSALADDELAADEVAALLDACREDGAALRCWATYQLIGEALRSPAQAAVGEAGIASAVVDAELAFVNRLSQRLAQEVVAEARYGLATEPVPAPALVPVSRQPAAALAHHRGPAANDGGWRWKLVAGVASLAAVSAIAWNALGLLAPASAPQMVQTASTQILVASPQGTMVRDARLDELLAAHKQFAATSALQESSGFVHQAAFEMPQMAPADR
jgi:sigma-E factor negative regulatory protein RseA